MRDLLMMTGIRGKERTHIILAMKVTTAIILFLTTNIVAGPYAFAQNAAPPRTGYLSPAEAPDVTKIVPAAPAPGDSRDILDRSIFQATRAFEGTPRWTLAQSDNNVSTAAMMKAFSCTVGTPLDAEKAPKLAALLGRMLTDATAAFNRLKNFYPERKRPFLVEQGPICLPITPTLTNGPDYPSGHSVFGWSAGLVLAELVPAQSTEILIRARVFGESRVICGVHNASAIEAGRMVAASTIAALHGNAAFRSDLEAVRSELSGLTTGTTQTREPMCAAESEVLAKPPY